ENDERLGVRFPDMLNAYDKNLINKALRIAESNNIKLHTGVYTSLQGPNLETPSEYRFVHRIGGDLVGMSSVPEVLVARHSGLGVMMLSLVSNKCYPIEEIKETTVEDVIAVANHAEPKMRFLIKEIIKS
ncbi:MAG TPA: purine-nucleoside phosphorylase, partial [Allocoleopsis sp.]